MVYMVLVGHVGPVQKITDSTKSTKIVREYKQKAQQAHLAKNTPSTLCKQRVNQNIWSTVCSAAPSTKPQTDCLPLTRAHTGQFFWLALIYHTCIYSLHVLSSRADPGSCLCCGIFNRRHKCRKRECFKSSGRQMEWFESQIECCEP